MKKSSILLLSLLSIFLSAKPVYSSNSNLQISMFKYERPVLRQDDEIPVVVQIWNGDLEDTPVDIKLDVSSNLSVKSGTTLSKTTLGMLSYTELRWTLHANSLGAATIAIKVSSAPGDTLKATLAGNVTDQYYKQKEFLLTAWSPPTVLQAAYNYYKGANFAHNLSINSPYGSGVNMVKANTMKCFVNVVDQIPGYGSKLYGFDGVPPEISTSDLDLITPTVNAYKTEAAVDGYHIIDEPGASRFANIAKVVSRIRAIDPLKLAYVNLFPTYATPDQLNTSTYTEYVSRFLDEVKPEMLSYDHYHFQVGFDWTDYFNNLAIIRDFGLKYNIPYTNIIQLVGTENPKAPQLNFRTPSPSEHRFLVYSTLAYGYTGIVWFHWQSSWGLTGYPAAQKEQLYATIRQLNKEITNIGKEMMKLKSTGVYHVNDLPVGTVKMPSDQIVSNVSGNKRYLVGLFKDQTNNDLFMVMNKDSVSDSQVTIKLKKQVSKLEYFDADVNTWISISNFTTNSTGVEFSMLLTAGNGILFRPTWLNTGINDVQMSSNQENVLAYPNPFQSTINIEYNLSKDQPVEFTITDLLGKTVFRSAKLFKSEGINTDSFNTSDLPGGIYLYNLKMKNSTYTGRIIRQ